MAITAASIEANGWVLRVTLTGALSTVSPTDTTGANFAGYALAPKTAPALTLALLGTGFVQSGGQAVASAAVSRALIGTKPLRRIVHATPAGVRDAKTPDETDNGDGTVTVRIALSQHVYQGDTGLTLTALAGWRAGATAQTVAVTNNSTILAPAPIVRWSDVSYQLQPGSFDLEIVVASHHPNGVAPVAGVRFTVTDGTTVKSFWTTALAGSTKYPATSGDGAYALPLRVYRVTVDPTTATALTKGLLRCDFEVYPWLGPVQKSDVAGTKSMTGLGTVALSTSAFVPFVVAYNPGNTWITPLYVDVDETNGTATATSVTVSSNPATAAAGTPAISINVAHQALENANVTVAAANGQAAITKSVDGAHIRLRRANAATGCTGIVNGSGSQAVGTGVQCLASWLTVEGDPAGASRVCILRSPATAAANGRYTRVRVTNLSIEAQTNTCINPTYLWADNFEVRGIAGQEATTGNPLASSNSLQFLTNGKWWRHGSTPAQSGSTFNPVMCRALLVEQTLSAPVLLACARLPTTVAAYGAVGGGSLSLPSTDPGFALERVAIGCDFRYLSNGGVAFGNFGIATANAPAGFTLGRTGTVVSRFAWLNNIAEVYGGVAAGMWGLGGGTVPLVATEFVIEGNTLTGDRTNNPYGGLTLATIALTDTTDTLVQVMRFANNVTMKNASKQDFYNEPIVLTQRVGVALTATRNKAYAVGAELVVAGSPANVYHCTTAGTTATSGGPTGTGSAIADGSVVWQWIATENRQHGYRPNAVSAWPSHYGVGYEGNIDFQGPAGPSYDPEFFFEFYGPGGDQLSVDGIDVAATPFTHDDSGTTPNRLVFQPTPDGAGGGDYRPLPTGSATYILGRAKTASIDVDNRGKARSVPFAAGAFEAAAVAVVPAAARSPSLAASPAVRWSTTLASSAAAMPSRAASSAAGWSVVLAPAGARLATRAANGAVGWSVGLVPVGGRLASRAASGAVTWSVGLASAGGKLATRAAAGAAGWSGTLAAQGARSAMRGSAPVVTWAVGLPVDSARSPTIAASGIAAWLATLLPDGARIPSAAAASAAVTAGPWFLACDSATIAIVDRTLPLLLPGSMTPPDRTLVVTGDLRTLTIDGSVTPF